MADPVTKPSHYQIAHRIEAIDIIEMVVDAFCLSPYEGYLMGNFLKYRLRIGDKDSVEQDLAKSNQYRDRLRALRNGTSDCEGDCENCKACKPIGPGACNPLEDDEVTVTDEDFSNELAARLRDDFIRKLRKTDPYPEY